MPSTNMMTILALLLSHFSSVDALQRLPVKSLQLASAPSVSRVALVHMEVDTKLLAADATIVFAYSFCKTLCTVLISPEFEGWFAPMRADPGRLSDTLNFASLWAAAWISACIALDAFAPGVDEESTRLVGPMSALRCFAVSTALVCALGLAVPDGVFRPLEFTLENSAAAFGIGTCLVAWRKLVADISLP